MSGEIDGSPGSVWSEEHYMVLQERIDGMERELERIQRNVEEKRMEERRASVVHLIDSEPVFAAYAQDYWTDETMLEGWAYVKWLDCRISEIESLLERDEERRSEADPVEPQQHELNPSKAKDGPQELVDSLGFGGKSAGDQQQQQQPQQQLQEAINRQPQPQPTPPPKSTPEGSMCEGQDAQEQNTLPVRPPETRPMLVQHAPSYEKREEEEGEKKGMEEGEQEEEENEKGKEQEQQQQQQQQQPQQEQPEISARAARTLGSQQPDAKDGDVERGRAERARQRQQQHQHQHQHQQQQGSGQEGEKERKSDSELEPGSGQQHHLEYGAGVYMSTDTGERGRAGKAFPSFDPD